MILHFVFFIILIKYIKFVIPIDIGNKD